MNKYQLFEKHEAERQEMTNRLQQANRELNQNMNEFEGWADRVMRSILAPIGSDIKTIWNASKQRNSNAPYKREQ